MKAFVYTCVSLLALLAGSIRATAQGLTNLNLESWVTRGAVERPVNWLTSDDVFAFYDRVPTGTYNFGLTTKTTDAHGGTYAAKLTTNYVTYQGQSAATTGTLLLGAKTGVLVDPFLELPGGGAPIAGKPTSMQFYYKSTVPAADTAVALVYLTVTTAAGSTVVGLGGGVLPAASAYTALSLPITYSTNNTATPDSVHIVFTSGTASYITIGAALFIDDITFSGIALASKAATDVQDRLTVSPNPSSGGRFVISSPAQPALAASPLQVFDLRGRLVLRQAAQGSPASPRELDLSSLSTGLYLLRLDSPQGSIVRQLTVQ